MEPREQIDPREHLLYTIGHAYPKTSRYFSLVTRPDSKRTLGNLSLVATCCDI